VPLLSSRDVLRGGPPVAAGIVFFVCDFVLFGKHKTLFFWKISVVFLNLFLTFSKTFSEIYFTEKQNFDIYRDKNNSRDAMDKKKKKKAAHFF
jgi:hypothetical protein